MSGNASQSETISEYSSSAFRSTDIPRQKPLEDPGGAIKALEGGDLIERLPWAAYSGLDNSLGPSSVETFKERAAGKGPKKLAGPAWTHSVSPKDLIKTRWQLLLLLAGSFADYGMLKWMILLVALTAIIVSFRFGLNGFIDTFNIAAVILLLHFFFRYPFTWVLERNLDFIITDLGCGYFRTTGMIKFRTWREETFKAPFIEFDPYISYHIQPKGPVSYKLQLRHRYTGKQTVVATVGSSNRAELYAEWDELQRYMDVTQPLPDIPALEPYRHIDPTTAEYDAAGKRERPADYWATLDLEWWEKQGYPAHMEKIRNFPWGSLDDQMQYSVPNLNEATMA